MFFIATLMQGNCPLVFKIKVVYPMVPSAAYSLAFARLVQVVAALRHPDHGCPWDLAQTHQTLKRFLLEETQETLTAINHQDAAALCEELGDVLLQVLLHSQVAQDNATFSIADVCIGLANKLVRRHPHVFQQTNTAIDSPTAVTQQWQVLKQQEKTTEPTAGILDGIEKGLPALTRSQQTSKRAVKAGFDWPDVGSLWQCVMSEFDEFRDVANDATLTPEQRVDRLEDEFGDILFATVNLGRHHGVDAETALHRAVDKFTQRFNTMEATAAKPLSELSFEEWDTLWSEAKKITTPLNR
jgi:tetrapyrrole methylase family protein / MazG family protein